MAAPSQPKDAGSRPDPTDGTGSGVRRAWDWFVLDPNTGESTVTMAPNLPISLFWGVTAVRVLARPAGVPGAGLRVAAGGALVWWAADELVRGTSPLRRTLGAVTLTLFVIRAPSMRTEHRRRRPPR